VKLLVVSTWVPWPPDNGSRVRAHQLLTRLARSHSITLLALGDPTTDVAPLREICRSLEVVRPSTAAGRRLTLRGLASPVPRYFVQSANARMHELVAAEAAKSDAGIALQVDAAAYLARCAHLPRVFDEAEVGLYRDAVRQARGARERLRRQLTWWKYGRFIKHLVGRFERTTVVSAIELGLLERLGCDMSRVAVVTNGTEVPDALPPRAPRPGQLIFTGPVAYPPNLDAVRYFVEEILPIVRRSRPDVTFVVTGSTAGVDVGALAARDGVRFTGRLRDVRPTLAESEVAVVPIRSGGGTRLKVLQAMGQGVPVVSTPKGVEGLDVDAGRDVLVADDARGFAAMVVHLLDSPRYAADLAACGYRRVSDHYRWERIGARFESVLASAVSAFGVPRAAGNESASRLA
jgi:polysaccharide biosynthesis protein PslH